MNEYNSKSCNALEKAFYTPMEAAIRWCNLIAQEVFILRTLEGNILPSVGQFPQWPCLRVNAEKIMDAINNENLPHGRDGKTVQPGDHVAPSRRTVRHTDLKKWMSEHYPDQKPAFLFDETERRTHVAFNTDSFRALQADCEANRIHLEKKTKQFGDLLKKHEALLGENASLRTMVEKPLLSKERASLLRLVLGMAIDGYGYDPKAVRSPTAGRIAGDLKTRGISIDEDTVRKWLNEAKESVEVPVEEINT